MDFSTFFAQYGLIILLAALLVFMFWSSRRRMQRQKAEQEEKARQTIPGAEVLLQGGVYGTIVEFDPDNLDQPAVVEISPGVEIRVHSQAVLRVVNSVPTSDEDGDEDQLEELDDDGTTDSDGVDNDIRDSDDILDGDSVRDGDSDSGAEKRSTKPLD